MESSVSELARVAIGERAVIEECGDLLYKTNTFQVWPSPIFICALEFYSLECVHLQGLLTVFFLG